VRHPVLLEKEHYHCKSTYPLKLRCEITELFGCTKTRPLTRDITQRYDFLDENPPDETVYKRTIAEQNWELLRNTSLSLGRSKESDET